MNKFGRQQRCCRYIRQVNNIQFDVTVMSFEGSENRIILPKLFFVEDDFFDHPKVD